MFMISRTIGDVFRAVTGFRPLPVAPVAPVAMPVRPLPVVPVVPDTRHGVLDLRPNDILLDVDGRPAGLVVATYAHTDRARVTVYVAPMNGGDAVPVEYGERARVAILSV